ncbi:MAG: biotin/lipoyl-containing protein [Clostridiaceae bacterium]
MRKFIVNVNGSSYEVEVEEISGGAAPAAAPIQTPAAPSVPVAPVAPAPATASNANGSPVAAPMPGTIVDVKISVGAKVKKGQVIIVLEAMKMENEILADRDGTIAALNVSKGSSVKSGDTLCLIG